MNGGKTCTQCSRPVHVMPSTNHLCAMHYRITNMRSTARRHGKYMPSVAEIEAVCPDPFICVGCEKPMHWLRSEGTSQQATLQHDRSGKIKIVCLACNSRHAVHPGDTFWDIPKDHKQCKKCDSIKSHSEFYKDLSRPIGLTSYCKSCFSAKYTKRKLKQQAKLMGVKAC